MQGGKVHETRLDVHEFLSPLFKKARAGITQSSANILSKVQDYQILYSKAMSDSLVAQVAECMLCWRHNIRGCSCRVRF